MKKIFTLLSILAIMISVQAQEQKLRVAIFDPTSSGTTIDEGTKLAVQELISSTLVNTGKYIIVERSMIDKIMREQAFQNSDMADNSQATEIGKLAGANKIVLSAVSLVGGRNMLSVKIIDVQTATIEQQKTKIVNTGDLLDVVEPLTLELLGEQAVYEKKETQFITQQKEAPKTVERKKQTQQYSGNGKEIILKLSEKKGNYINAVSNVTIFCDNEEILNQNSGVFVAKFHDANLGNHNIKISLQWDESQIIQYQDFNFTINTAEDNEFEFIGDTKRGKPVVEKMNTFRTTCEYECKPCNIKVACSDMPNELSWHEAMNPPDGWRLPTVEELQCMCRYKNQIPNFTEREYWTSGLKGKKAILVTTNDREEETDDKEEEHYVRYVKSY